MDGERQTLWNITNGKGHLRFSVCLLVYPPYNPQNGLRAKFQWNCNEFEWVRCSSMWSWVRWKAASHSFITFDPLHWMLAVCTGVNEWLATPRQPFIQIILLMRCSPGHSGRCYPARSPSGSGSGSSTRSILLLLENCSVEGPIISVTDALQNSHLISRE